MNNSKLISILTPLFFLLLTSCSEKISGAFPDSADIPDKHQDKLQDALAGDADAQLAIATVYMNGLDIPINKSKAMPWITIAANNGHLKSQHKLATLYMTGEAGKQDKEKSFKWFQKAAESGEVNSMFQTGLFYKKGDFVKKNYLKAYQWMKLSLAVSNKNGNNDPMVDYKIMEVNALKSNLKKKEVKQAELWIKQKLQSFTS